MPKRDYAKQSHAEGSRQKRRLAHDWHKSHLKQKANNIMETTLTPITATMREALRSEFLQPSIGDNEYELSVQRAACKWNGSDPRQLAKMISCELDTWRDVACAGPNLRSEQAWKKARRESERTAKAKRDRNRR